ncbi:MAG: hypothetical protein HYY06_09820 [Deltaproteobacteria bacterium]|nr:hypothetical protein [Deltaproteobacteria bacterium]
MNELPLHPAIVHVPLGVSAVVPLVAIGIAVAIWRRGLPRRTWLAVLGLQAVVVATAAIALRSGEEDEERVEERVSEASIEEHEERAQAFTWGAAAVLVVGITASVVRSARASGLLMAAAATGSIVVLGLGLAVGHAGGTLVHGAGGLAAGGSAVEATGEQGEQDRQGERGQQGERGERGERGEEHERREHRDRDDD